MSVDGVIEATETWHYPTQRRDGGAIGEAISSADAFLLGRRTYQAWSEYWPLQSADENPTAEVINGRPKYVVSKTVDEVTWQNSTLLGADPPASSRS
ncbi:MAG: dihydrofolate reductase family protein [Gaiellales bacterium]